MTAALAMALSLRLLEHFLGVNTRWVVDVVPELPGHPDKGGHCDDESKRITLVERCLANDANALRIIVNEVAHALTPNDWKHGEEWQTANARLRRAG